MLEHAEVLCEGWVVALMLPEHAETNMVNVFISYSHADETLRQELDKHLMALKRQGLIDVWHDRRITAGEEWADQIDANLRTADVILLLVSPDFIASSYCYEKELQEALDRHEQGKTIVIPVILRPCEWKDLSFGKLQAATKDGRPVIKYGNLDDAFLEVTLAVKAAVARINARSGAPTARPGPAATVEQSANRSPSGHPPAQRSSNLSVAKSFSQYDYSKFLAEAMDYIASFFENSLNELHTRNPQIQSTFRRPDKDGFDAGLFQDGKRVASCGVWIGNGMFGGHLQYSSSGLGNRNSYNESLTMGDDGHVLGFKSLLLGSGSGGEKLLSLEGAAEHLWAMFVGPLQRRDR